MVRRTLTCQRSSVLSTASKETLPQDGKKKSNTQMVGSVEVDEFNMNFDEDFS